MPFSLVRASSKFPGRSAEFWRSLTGLGAERAARLPHLEGLGPRREQSIGVALGCGPSTDSPCSPRAQLEPPKRQGSSYCSHDYQTPFAPELIEQLPARKVCLFVCFVQHSGKCSLGGGEALRKRFKTNKIRGFVQARQALY